MTWWMETVHVTCYEGEIPEGVERKAFHTTLMCSHLYPLSLKNNCPIPAFRADFTQHPCFLILRDLLIESSAWREQDSVQQANFSKTSDCAWEILHETNYLHRSLETAKCFDEGCTDTSNYPRPPFCPTHTILETWSWNLPTCHNWHPWKNHSSKKSSSQCISLPSCQSPEPV